MKPTEGELVVGVLRSIREEVVGAAAAGGEQPDAEGEGGERGQRVAPGEARVRPRHAVPLQKDTRRAA